MKIPNKMNTLLYALLPAFVILGIRKRRDAKRRMKLALRDAPNLGDNCWIKKD